MATTASMDGQLDRMDQLKHAQAMAVAKHQGIITVRTCLDNAANSIPEAYASDENYTELLADILREAVERPILEVALDPSKLEG